MKRLIGATSVTGMILPTRGSISSSKRSANDQDAVGAGGMMTYESVLQILVLTGAVGFGFLLILFREVLYYVRWDSRAPETIVTDAAIWSTLLWFMYGALLVSQWHLGWPKDTRLALLVIATGYTVFPIVLVVRWVWWRYVKDGE